MSSSAFGFDTSTYAPGVSLGSAGVQPVGNSPFGIASSAYAPGVSIEQEKKKKKNKNKNQGEFPGETTSYAPGASVGVPTEASAFVDQYITKKGKIKNKDMKAFREAGGDMNDLRDLFENQDSIVNQAAGIPSFDLNKRGLQALQNQSASMDYVDTNEEGKPKVQSFIDEFANARGRITRQDMRAFEKAGGNLSRLDKKLQKGGFTRNEVKAVEENLNKRGTAIKAGNEDYYTGGAGKNFLDRRLGRMISDETEDLTPTEEIIEEITTPPSGIDESENPVGEGGTPDAGLDLGLKVDYGDIDPSSGFPYNPGRQTGEPFTDYQDRIPEIIDATDKRLEEKGVYDRRMTAEDTATQSYFNKMIDGGILPGSPGYVSAAEKNALRGAANTYDRNDPDLIESRKNVLEDKLAAVASATAARNDAQAERHWGKDGTYAQAMAELNKNLKGRADIFEPYPTAPIDLRTPEPKEKKKTNAKLPDLPDRPKGGMVEAPGLFETKTITTEGRKPPDDFKKNPAFDGSKNFSEFVARASMGGGAGKLYDALRNAGLSEEEMYKGAQYAGITNLRTSDSSIKDDIEAIKHAVDNNYYEGWDGKDQTKKVEKLKSQKDLYNWYKGQGGNDKLSKLIRQAGYNKYNSENDANKLVDVMQNSLRKDGVRAKPPQRELRSFNEEMDAIAAMFGGKYRWSSYQDALKKGDASKVNQWVKNYIDLGGGVGQRVIDAMKDQG